MRILAVDDDPVSLRILAFHLRKAGFDVLTATTGAEGLEVALKEMPQMVISDFAMPDMDGLEFCAALRRIEAGARIYFVLLTAREDEDKVVEAFDKGVDDYVHKPFKPRVMLARIRAGNRVVELQRQVERDALKMQEQVAELGVLNRKLHQASVTDPLTSLPNRRFAMGHLQTTWDTMRDGGGHMSVVMLDIDHFKGVNDTHGHDAGDEVLKRTAEVLERTRRQHEVACRLGGEEFLIVCPEASEEDAVACAERVRQAVEANQIEWGTFEGNVTISLGVAQSNDEMESVDQLLKAADEAVYVAKEGGRNRVERSGVTERV